MTILITGGSKGIGRGIAARFAASHAHVLINYAHDDDAATRTAAELREAGGRIDLVKADLSSPGGVTELAQAVAQHTDHLDQVVHGAVWPYSAPALEISTDAFEKAVWTNGTSLLALVQSLRPLLHAGASIFLITSRGSELAVPNYIAVGAPKALAEAIVRYLAVALAPDGIRINSVSVSTVLTDAIRSVRPDAEEHASRMAGLNPSGRNVTPADVAAAIFHLANPELEMMTGRKLHVDGGVYVAAN